MMIYLAIYLYVAGMPVAVHLADECFKSVTAFQRFVAAAIWPLLLFVYVWAFTSVLLERR